MKLNDVFESTPKSVHEVISESGTCFHIPEYQRPYSWNQDKVTRLIDDIRAGCSVLVEHDDAITFLGTLLTVDDYKGDSLSPELKKEKPPKTRLVIDGQQRLTTLTLLCTRLYLRLESYLGLMTNLAIKFESEAEAEELVEQVNKFADNIHNLSAGLRFFSKDTNSRDKYNRYYPLLTRSSEDIWSRQKNLAKYKSSIAEYINKVNVLAVDEQFSPLPSAEDKTVSLNLKAIDRELANIADGYIFNSDSICDLSDINFKYYQQETYFDVDKLPHLLKNEKIISPKDNKQVREAVYLSMFSSYLLYRTCFTFVSVNNLDYAFDMFEALNTTGEPLTAYETFRPKAIQFFHCLKQESQFDEEELGREYLGIIDDYLNSISDATKKNDATKKLIDTFSYALNGKMSGTHISQQRRFLIDTFASSDNKLAYLEQLAHTAEFLFSIWYEQDEKIISKCLDTVDQRQEFRLAISVLTSTGHEIARPFLAVAYNNFKSTGDIENLKKAATLLTSFWVLRRVGTGGTASIDSRYKELYSGSALGEKVVFGFNLFSHLSDVSNYFTQDMAQTFSGKGSKFDKIKTKLDWRKKAVLEQQYKTGKQLGICRLLLLSSMHDVTVDPDCAWKTVLGKDGSNPTLSYYNWIEFFESGNTQFTIEHISPQNPKLYDWDSSLDDGELTNTLGNLVILARGDNSEASNDSWLMKQQLYSDLAEKKYESGIDRNYNKFIKTVSSAPAWRKDIVLERGANLLDNSWNNLIKWLVV